MIYYIYNGSELLGFVYKDKTYYYHKNMFGDIIGILDSNYNEIVTYEYDSWGALVNITDNSSINLGTINPFRYRGYYYDEETSLYYLNSRYYNPQVGRFINADGYVSANNDAISANLFQYVSNNPLNFSDKDGKKFMRPTKWLARNVWKIVTNCLRKKGLNNSADLLEHSLYDNPDNVTYDKNSDLAEKISSSFEYNDLMSDIIKNADKNGNVYYDTIFDKSLKKIQFESDNDLFGSLHGVDITVKGNINDGKLNVLITDYYDFKYEKKIYGDSFFKIAALFGNNLAYLDQCTGVINGYYIYVELECEV